MQQVQRIIRWGTLACLAIVPVIIAGSSPYLQYREMPYIVAGFAGILCLSAFLIQPLLGAGVLPDLSRRSARRLHLWLGRIIALCVLLHIAGLYVTSPPDTIDALLLRSPTPFSVFGVIATVAVVLTLGMVAARRLMRRARHWHMIHHVLSAVIVSATVIHALLIQGTMGTVSKVLLCAAVVLVNAYVLLRLRFRNRS